MKITAVTVFVKPENVADFIRATVENHEASVLEPGNLRFDVLQSRTDPCRFLLYEAYETDEQAAAHKDMPHYKKWRQAVEPWMARPREGIEHDVIAPSEAKKWK